MTTITPPRLPRWLERMVPFERHVVPIENHRLHVMERGRGNRVVLCLHGNPTWGFLYRKVALELDESRFRVVMPDLVGLGWSSRPDHPHAHTLENHARWIGKLIDAEGYDDYILVVQDWGGVIGLLAAERAVKPPAGVVLLNTVVGPPRPGFTPTAFHAFSQMPVVSDLAFRVGGFPQRALWAAQGNRRSISGQVQRAYIEPLRGLKRNAAPLAMARMVPSSASHSSIASMERSQEFITSFDGPVAAVWGERDPVLGTVGRWIEKLLPDARMVHTNAGHFIQEEVPEPIARAIEWVDLQST